jgi:hypothetical protein
LNTPSGPECQLADIHSRPKAVPEKATTGTQTTTARNVQSTAAATRYYWNAIQQEKARALFAKYGLTLEPGEWVAPRDVTIERVEKPIRMRVRRACHRCRTTFGPTTVCINCQHVRCKKCPRYPPSKTEEAGGKQAAKPKAKIPVPAKEDPAVPHSKQKQKQKQPPLTLPSRKGGQDLIRKPIMQRVRRNCHKCGTLFRGDGKECPGCNHTRCKKCPRDPYVMNDLARLTTY